MFKSIVLHIPHSSDNFDFAGQDRYVEGWRRQAEPLIDWYTDELFNPAISDERVIPVIFDTCRTLVDVERMCQDPLENKGLGITSYALLHTAGELYKVRESKEEVNLDGAGISIIITKSYFLVKLYFCFFKNNFGICFIHANTRT